MPTPVPDSSGRLIFVCPGCKLTLSATPQYAGVCAPCPSCGVPVNAPGLVPVDNQTLADSPNLLNTVEAREAPSHGMSASSGRRKGGIVADSAVDHQHSDQREVAKSLWIIAMFILAMAACLAVTWFLKDWIRK